MLWSLLEGFFLSSKERLIDSVASWLDAIFALVATPFTFDWLSSFMVFFQGLAIAVVFLIVMARGITTGILAEGGVEGTSVGRYLYRSFVPVALIAATPAIVGCVTTVTTTFVGLVAGSGSEALASLVVDNIWAKSSSIVSVEGAADSIITSILLFVILYYFAVVSLQIVKRWIQLSVLSLILPLTCIFTAAEDTSDYVTALKSMGYIGVVTALQIVLLKSVPAMPDLGFAMAGAQAGLAGAAGAVMLTVGTLAAIKALPDWIEKYTAASSVAARSGVGTKVLSTVRASTSIINAVKR